MAYQVSIKEAIANLYLVFSKYTTSDMFYCDCGCIEEEDVRKLASKKLRDLDEDDFCSYHGSALYTWGDLNHYKHFLPRILEVHHQKEGRGLIDLYDMISKLDYASWSTWDQIEVQAIKDFIWADWNELLHARMTVLEIDVIENYNFFLTLGKLLNAWKLECNSKSLKNFVHFFYQNGTRLLSKDLKLNGETYTNDLRSFLAKPCLIEILEKEFFHADENDKNYAAKVSAVTQMIECEKDLATKNLDPLEKK